MLSHALTISSTLAGNADVGIIPAVAPKVILAAITKANFRIIAFSFLSIESLRSGVRWSLDRPKGSAREGEYPSAIQTRRCRGVRGFGGKPVSMSQARVSRKGSTAQAFNRENSLAAVVR